MPYGLVGIATSEHIQRLVNGAVVYSTVLQPLVSALRNTCLFLFKVWNQIFHRAIPSLLPQFFGKLLRLGRKFAVSLGSHYQPFSLRIASVVCRVVHIGIPVISLTGKLVSDDFQRLAVAVAFYVLYGHHLRSCLRYKLGCRQRCLLVKFNLASLTLGFGEVLAHRRCVEVLHLASVNRAYKFLGIDIPHVCHNNVVAVVVGIHSCYLLAELNRNLWVYHALQTCFKQSASAEICA